MANKWLDCIEKQKRSNVCDNVCDRQTRVNDKKIIDCHSLGAEIKKRL